jgi:hypothetical protein
MADRKFRFTYFTRSGANHKYWACTRIGWGPDGTEATLRGFRNLRFRDRDLLLMQAEYRLPVWGPVEATVFADAGKVAGQRSDLDLTDLRRDFGFSASMMQKWSTVARVDVGFGSGEGARVFFTFGGLTP